MSKGVLLKAAKSRKIPGPVTPVDDAGFTRPGTGFSKPPFEKSKPPIEKSIPGTEISIGGVGRHFCWALPFCLKLLPHCPHSWLKGLIARARVRIYVITILGKTLQPFSLRS